MKTMVPLLLAALALFAPIEAAHAAAQRTFVASGGSDANPCTLPLPCRSFTAALVQTSGGGEIIVLDSAGYGPVTIAQSVSIIAPPGIYAGISASIGSGILVTGSGLRVVLRGLAVNGTGANDGIDVFPSTSEVRIERCAVRGFTHEGIRTGGTNLRVFIQDTEVSANQLGVFVQDGSIVHLERVSMSDNSGSGLAIGIAADNNKADVVVRDSVIRGSDTGINAVVSGTNRVQRLTVDRTVVSGSVQTGIRAGAFAAGAIAFTTVVRSTIVHNGGSGVEVSCTGGGLQSADIEANAISDNGGSAIQASGAGCAVTAARNTISRNAAVGLDNLGASFTSFQNNELSNNGPPTAGSITTGFFH